MKLSHWQKFQKLHIYSLSTPWGFEIALYQQRFSRYGPIFKNAIIEHETWPPEKVIEIVHTLFLPQGIRN